jgi:pimeloyl-ACP methyl ester carboxylesterase
VVDAFVLHEIVQGLRHGAAGGVPFGRVIEVGHSLGSLIVWQEASTYHDVAGVIVTGATHYPVPDLGSIIAQDFHPAVDDPAFADSGLDTGYITTIPGTRGSLFYNPADSDPAVIAADEASKDVVSLTDLAGAGKTSQELKCQAAAED